MNRLTYRFLVDLNDFNRDHIGSRVGFFHFFFFAQAVKTKAINKLEKMYLIRFILIIFNGIACRFSLYLGRGNEYFKLI